MSNKLQLSFLKTLHYHDCFDFPLTKKEFWQLLILKNHSTISFKDFNCYLNKLVKENKIIAKNNYFFLPGREKIISLRSKKEIYSQKKLKQAFKFVQLIKHLPWIKFIGITGALAMSNSLEDDDIDLMIITSNNRLWIIRLLLVFLLEFKKKRRRPKDKAFKDKFCLNLFLDESALYLPGNYQNLYIAHEVVQLKTIYNKDNTWEQFILINSWIKNFLPNAKINFIVLQKLGVKKRSSKIINLINLLAFKLQYLYMQPKKTVENVSLHWAFFHPVNRSAQILKKFNEI